MQLSSTMDTNTQTAQLLIDNTLLINSSLLKAGYMYLSFNRGMNDITFSLASETPLL